MQRKPIPRTAYNTMLDLLARRDHAPLEIQQKLLKREFGKEEIARAIALGQERGLLPSTAEAETLLAERMSQGLHRRKKGIHAISKSLQQKGLPALSANPTLELEKAMAVLASASRRELKRPKRTALKPRLKAAKGQQSSLSRWSKALSEQQSQAQQRQKDQAKWIRMLSSRGFQRSIIQQAIQQHMEQLLKETPT